MSTLNNRLKELVGDDVEKIVQKLNFCNKSLVYKWIKDDNLPTISNLCKLADHFNISIDYLLGRTDDYDEITGYYSTTFHVRFEEILKKKNITKYKLFKDLNFSKGLQYSWFTLKKIPSTENLIKIADYLGVSIDFLIGRV